MQKFVFILTRKDSCWKEEKEEEDKTLIFAVIIKTLVSVLKREKQRTFRGDRDEDRERESSRPSRDWEDATLRLNVLKLRDFVLRANVLYETRPAVHTNTHLVECKRTMCFFFFIFLGCFFQDAAVHV